MVNAGVPPNHRADTAVAHRRAVQLVIEAMRGGLEQEVSLEEMAELAIMSPFHFNRTFREITGLPPCQFLSTLRLAAAKRLLVDTDLSVTDVCFEVGYNSLGTFIRRFTDLVGFSPRRLRQLARLPLREVIANFTPLVGVAGRSGLRGSVKAPPGFRGQVFIGLFDASSPQGRPASCTVLDGPGRYAIPVPRRRGVYHLMAAGVPESSGPREYLLCESAVRAGGKPVVVGPAAFGGATDLVLRAPEPIDPPIVMSLLSPPSAEDRQAARAAPRRMFHVRQGPTARADSVLD